MEKEDKLDSMMADLLGFENEYDILNQKSKVCIITIISSGKYEIERNFLICNAHIYDNDYFLILFLILDSRRNRKMVYQRRHARSKKTSTFNEKGLRGLENISKYFTTFSY